MPESDPYQWTRKAIEFAKNHRGEVVAATTGAVAVGAVAKHLHNKHKQAAPGPTPTLPGGEELAETAEDAPDIQHLSANLQDSSVEVEPLVTASQQPEPKLSAEAEREASYHQRLRILRPESVIQHKGWVHKVDWVAARNYLAAQVLSHPNSTTTLLRSLSGFGKQSYDRTKSDLGRAGLIRAVHPRETGGAESKYTYEPDESLLFAAGRPDDYPELAKALEEVANASESL
ncbi:MAG TPA: hypothetical protein VG604_01505 [Candidatus Saccharimonadales bacterium]|nr:hypothetical protein [Candidatus Saccharimonadales bacterium]